MVVCLLFLPEKVMVDHCPNPQKSEDCWEIQNTISLNAIEAVPPMSLAVDVGKCWL